MTTAARRKCIWRFSGEEFDLRNEFLVQGVLNVTPDSFYDGGEHLDQDAAIKRAEVMVEEGASIIDVGGESTRPGSATVSADEQNRRVLGVVEALAGRGIIVSIDTRSASVARRAIDAGAKIVNDVSGLSDPDMLRAVREQNAGLVLMHSKGEPKTMQQAPFYENVIAEVDGGLEDLISRAGSSGIARDCLAIDVGIGFGKRLQDNLELLARLDFFDRHGLPILVGISRKSFLARIGAGVTPSERLAGSLAASVLCYEKGARIFRTHDPKETTFALRTAKAVMEASGAV